MRRTLVLASFVFLSGNTTTCNLTGPVEHPEAGFSHAVATMICGLADGPATGILLGQNPIPSPLEPSYPYVRVSIWQPVGTLKSLYVIDATQGDVSAQYFLSAGEFLTATTGTVRIDRVSSNNRIEGSVDLRFPGGKAVTEGFSAPWIESFILCG